MNTLLIVYLIGAVVWGVTLVILWQLCDFDLKEEMLGECKDRFGKSKLGYVMSIVLFYYVINIVGWPVNACVGLFKLVQKLIKR
jgi:hypothetical protein